MNTSAPPFVETVPWDQLQHAYGPASDIPGLLKQIATAKGGKLAGPMDELCSRVLHQGTIYSASPPVAHVFLDLLAEAAMPEKLAFYHMLNGFAEASRRALKDGRAIPCCAGGDPVDGAAIRDEIFKARDRFAADLRSAAPEIRAQAAELLTAFPEAGSSAAELATGRYLVESDPSVRHALLIGLNRLRASVDDWRGFLATAVGREDDPANRFLLRAAQIEELKSAADAAMVGEFVSAFVATSEAAELYVEGGDLFFQAAQSLGEEREVETLLLALNLAVEHNLLLTIAERLLRVVFDDERTGWENTGYSILNEDGSEPQRPGMTGMVVRAIGMLIVMKLFPFYIRWKLRRKAGSKPKGMPKVDYWQLQGDAPLIPPRLTSAQQTALTALAAKPELWRLRTNLWQLFGLPAAPEELRLFVADRS